MQLSIIEKVIIAMNQEFEYYFEEYPEVDQSDIWWIYDSKKSCIRHVCNDCQKIGDLAIYYYQKGFCPIYAQILKHLFPDGEICHSVSHMIFSYQNHYYDASGAISINPYDYIKTPESFSFQTFSQYDLNSYGNRELAKIMYQKGLEVLNNASTLKKTKKIS